MLACGRFARLSGGGKLGFGYASLPVRLTATE